MERARSVAASSGRWLAAMFALAAGSYAAYVAYAWARYGHTGAAPTPDEQDAILDRFMPVYDVAERHHVDVSAPADVTFEAASWMDLQASPLIRAIFKGREWIMRSRPADPTRPGRFVDQMSQIGWGTLAHVDGRQIVMGAVTQPWLADVVFRPLAPDAFAAFREPGFVKIAWTLRADPSGPIQSVFRTETRVVTTDPVARSKFRRYWAFASPGILLIRKVSLGLVKEDAERRAKSRRGVVDESL